ncbi:RibD family protein [Amorphus coralli]|uniref:RibD family protein n=1 Tax=Amorphus coralli TaxID=340680 RepID=UPI00037EAEA9|nr:dihydrofolate reductase family protein [Amorphus coralli]
MTVSDAPAAEQTEGWQSVLRAAQEGGPIPPHWDALYGPLVNTDARNSLLLAQLGQSLDGRIATSTGKSRYINGRDCLVHLHRLRALVDIVIVGVGTVVADDPQLNVRFVEGSSPARAVIDPTGRMPATSRMITSTQQRTILITGEATKVDLPAHVDLVRLPLDGNGRLDPAAIRAAVAERGYRRMLLEGGAATVSAFLQARCLDRLHLLVAPIIIGAGRAGISLPFVDSLDEAVRPKTTACRLGAEIVYDCDFRG